LTNAYQHLFEIKVKRKQNLLKTTITTDFWKICKQKQQHNPLRRRGKPIRGKAAAGDMFHHPTGVLREELTLWLIDGD
jgi:hypothetical protein